MSSSKKLPPRLEPSRSPATQPSLADEAVSRVADERDYIQKKVFTKWCNIHLSKANAEIEDLFEDFRDGKKLILLLEILTDEKLPRQRGSLRFHLLQNVSTALDFLRSRKIKLINIRNDDIVDGNSKLTLGLVWTIILHFQISQVQVLFDEEKVSPKTTLLLWCKAYCDGYPNVNITNFTTSWSDGLAFNAIIHRHRPELIDYESMENASPSVRLENAFSVAEKELGIHRLLDAEDVIRSPDDKSIVTYVSSIHKVLPSKPPVLLTQLDEDLKMAHKTYCERATVLVKWARSIIVILDNKEIPNQLFMVQDVYNQNTFLKINILPQKDAERRQINVLYKDIQAMGNPMKRKIEIPDGLSPDEIDALWAQLLTSHENKHVNLRAEIERLEHLSHIAEKVETDAALVESSLNDVEAELDVVEEKMEKTQINDNTKVTYLQKFNQINKALMMFNLSIKTMSTSVTILIEGNYYDSESFKTRVYNITIRWEQLQKRININIQNLIGTRTSVSSIEDDHLPIEEPIIVDEEQTVEATPIAFDQEMPAFKMDEEDASISTKVVSRGSRTVVVGKPRTSYKIKVAADKPGDEETIGAVQVPMAEEAPSILVVEEALVEPSNAPVAKEAPVVLDEKPPQTTSSTKITISSKREAAQTPDVPKKKLKKSKKTLTAPWNCASKVAKTDSSDEDVSQTSDTKPVEGWPDMTLNAKLQEIRVAHHWIQFKKKTLEDSEYGMDLPTNESYLVENEKQFQEIRMFKIEVEKVCKLELRDPPDEIKYKITELEDAYSLLVIVVAKRHKYLTDLVSFMKDATQQLIWMNQKEEIEVTRDWSDKDIDLNKVDKYSKELQKEMKPREKTIDDVVKRGKDLIQEGHPAPAAIEAYITVLEAQWTWICQLQIAYKAHHKNASIYQKFFREATLYEKWLVERVDRLQPMLNGVDFGSADTLVSLIQILLEIRQQLMDHQGIASSLQKLSKDVSPLRQRKQKIKEPKSILTVCDYSQEQDVVCRGDQLDLTDNSDPYRWKVSPPSGLELEVPSVCFIIPAPDAEATELATRIEIQYKHLLTLWKNRHWHVKQALDSSEVFTSLKILKTPGTEKLEAPELLSTAEQDVDQLLKEFEQEVDPLNDDEAIEPDLNAITEQFLQEQFPPQQRQDIPSEDIIPTKDKPLEEEPVEQIQLGSLQEVPLEETPLHSASPTDEKDIPKDLSTEEQIIYTSIEELLQCLTSIENMLNGKKNINVDADTILPEMTQTKETLKELETELQPKYDSLVMEKPRITNTQLTFKITVLIEKWNVVSYRLKKWSERLDHSRVVLLVATDLNEWLANVEDSLVQQHGITTDPEDVSEQHEDLLLLQKEHDLSKVTADKLRVALINLPDVDLTETYRVIEHWEKAGVQLQGRIPNLKSTKESIVKLRKALQCQLDWLNNVHTQLKQDEELPEDVAEMEKLLDLYTKINEEIAQHRKPIQEIFYKSEEFILHSKAYEKDLDDYRQFVEEHEDRRNRYRLGYEARRWLALKVLKLTQLYELVLTSIPRRIAIILREVKQKSGMEVDEMPDDEYKVVEELLNQQLAWVKEKEAALLKSEPPYNAPEELTNYVQELQLLE